eukprot:6065420-Prymnesium_polylepis.1
MSAAASCSSASLAHDPTDRQASAYDPAIQQAEAVRASLRPIKFFLYDGHDLGVPGFSLQDTLDQMRDSGCLFATPRKGMAHYLAEYYFLRALSTHRWRVFRTDEAVVLVVPLLLSVELRGLCPWYNSSSERQALLAHRAWRTRRAEHLLVGSD